MIKGLILIGGKSSRMGTDKFKIPFNGKAQYQHLSDIFLGLEIPHFISCNKQQDGLIPIHFDTIIDRYDAIGPLGGILSALETDPDATWLVIACDLPFISSGNIKSLLSKRDPNSDATTFQIDSHFFEATFSVYEPSAYEWLNNTLKTGNYSLQNALKKMRLKIIQSENSNDLLNINTQEDLENFKKLKGINNSY